jgi:putative alpha-1,2-mannosidase
MKGDPGAVMIAEAYALGAIDFNTSGALHFMIAGQSIIREGFSEYVKLGYVPSNFSNSAAVTEEYASDDLQLRNSLAP